MKLELNFEGEPFRGYTEFDEFKSSDPELFEGETSYEWMGEVSRSNPEYKRWVQQSLNNILSLQLQVDGIVGPKTRSAIRSFQQRQGLKVDGVVGPQTEQALMTATQTRPPASGVTPAPTGPSLGINTPLPESGPGFRAYQRNQARRYGLPETIRALQAIAAAWQRAHPQGPRIGTGDISFQGGGRMPPHKSHNRGVDVDIRLLRNDGREDGTNYRAATYSRALTQELVNLIRANGVLTVKLIFFNDPAVSGVSNQDGHDDHLHVRFCTPGDTRCRPQMQREVSWAGETFAEGEFQQTAPPRHSTWSQEREVSGEINRQSADYLRWLQASLNRALGVRLAVDGKMGVQTRSALRSFQQSAGITSDGQPGRQTERALNAAGAGSPPATSVLPATPGAPSIPALLNLETAPPAQSLYVNIALGSESPARPMTGLFIPPDYQPQPQVDLVLYLHGFKPQGHADLTIDRYWNSGSFPYWPLRERLAEGRKNLLLVAPTLGPHSQTNKLTQPGGLDTYLAQVLAALAAHGPYRNTGQTPRLGQLILACHSGGGLPMRQLALSNNRAAQQIRECWGFDCTYNRGDDTEWARWARARPESRLFIYCLAGTRTAVLSHKLRDLKVPNVSVVDSPARGHNWVPIQHWLERIQAAPFLRSL